MTNEINNIYNEIKNDKDFMIAHYANELSNLLGVKITKNQMKKLASKSWDEVQEFIVDLAVAGYKKQ